MKKYSFRLEPVLKYKNDKLEIIKNEHAKIINKMVKQEEKIEGMEKGRSQFEISFNQKKSSGITPFEAINYENYLEHQTYMIKQEYGVLNGIKAEEAEKKEELLEAKKEVLTIEKLKEISMEQYRQAVNKENELFIEEFVSNSRVAVKVR